jgi:hypothetical protein
MERSGGRSSSKDTFNTSEEHRAENPSDDGFSCENGGIDTPESYTLREPPDKLRAVNLAIEHGAWGAFRTEFYATYDFRPVREDELKKKP